MVGERRRSGKEESQNGKESEENRKPLSGETWVLEGRREGASFFL